MYRLRMLARVRNRTEACQIVLAGAGTHAGLSTIVDSELLLAFGGALHVASGFLDRLARLVHGAVDGATCLLSGPALLARGLAVASAERDEHGREQEGCFLRHGKDYYLV